MPRKVLITKDTLQEILAKYQGGGSSSVGSSGKLYELQFSLNLYDENGNEVSYVPSPYSNPKFICTISENNFERFKQFVNAFAQQHGSAINISTINDVVSVLNGFNKTQGWQDNALAPDTYYGNNEYTMLSFLFAFADKTLLRVEIPTSTPIVYFGQVLSSTADGILLCYYGQANSDGIKHIPYENDDGVDWYYLGLNVNNSCTLTEYGTSSDGQGGGSGTQEVSFDAETGIYRFALTVYTDKEIDLNIYLDGDCMLEAVRTIATMQHISPAPTTINLDALNDMLENATHAERINFFNIGCMFAFSHGYSVADGQNFQAQVSTMYFDNSKFYTKENDTPSELFDISEVVDTSYLLKSLTSGTIQVSGGSGSSADTLKNYNELLTFYDQNGDKICGINKILSLKTKEWYYGVLNTGIQSAASMLGLTISTVTDDNTAKSGINTILGAMQQAGVSANIPQLIMNFVTDFNFVIKERVSNAGTEVYPLFVTGDISAYILYGDGTMTDLLQTFDFTGAYTVDYSLIEVNVTD